jgi:flagellar motility protein MotE (MotC chaperone)
MAQNMAQDAPPPAADAPRARLLPLVIGLAALAFLVQAAGLVHSVRALAQDDPPPAAQDDLSAPGPVVAIVDAPSEEDTAPAATLDAAPTPAGGWRDAIDVDVGGADTREAVAQDLVARAADLDARAAELDTRAAMLQAAEGAMTAKYAELKALQAQIAGDLKVRDTAREGQIDRLVKIYEGMKAKDAARLFNTQDPELLVDVMGKMSARKLAPLLAAMNPERARMLTAMLAEAAPPPAPK